MRISENFERLFCCIFLSISSVNLQNQEWDSLKLQTEVIRMNEKFNYVIEAIERMQKNSTQDQLIRELAIELQLSKNEIVNIKKENADQHEIIIQLSADSQKSKTEIKNLLKENTVQKQLIQQILMDLKQLVYELNDIKKENTNQGQLILKQSFDKIIQMKKELSVINRRDELIDMSVSLTKPQIYSRYFGEYYKKKADFTWIINDMHKKMKQTTFILLSDIFLLKGYSFAAQAKFAFVRDKRTYVSLSFKDINEGDQGLNNLTLIPAVYFTFKNPAHSSNDVIRHGTAQSNLKYDAFYYDNWLVTADHNYSDIVSIDIHVEPPWVAQQVYTYDGTIVWAIPHFRKKRELAKSDCMWYQLSPYFYTAPKGYRVQIYARMNGYWEYWEIGLTFTINFLSGPNDARLSKSFPHKITVTLLHPTDPANHLIRSVEKKLDGGRWYHIHIATHEEIDQFLDKDTLYYQVVIVPI